MKKSNISDILVSIEKSFSALYSSDSRAACYYYDKPLMPWKDFHSNAEEMVRIYQKSYKNVNPLDHNFPFDENFLLMARTVGLRLLFGSNLFLHISADGNKVFKDFSENFSEIKKYVDLSKPEVIAICLKSRRKAVGDDLYNFDNEVLSLRKDLFLFSKDEDFLSFSSFRDKSIFVEICKSIIENGDVDYMSSWYSRLKMISDRIDACREIISSAESVWAFGDIEEYKKIKLSPISEKPYTVRATTMAAIIMSGKADRYLIRKVRSDQSFSASLFCVKAFFEYKYRYEEKEWNDMAANLCDSRHSDVVSLLVSRLPKNLLAFLLSNDHANKDLVFERLKRD